MCRVVYVAADAPLPTIADGDPSSSGLTVRPIDSGEEPVRAHFTKPHVYFLGAHTGCSCGFSYGYGGAEDEAAGRDSVRRLGAYLAAAVARAGRLELYTCWDGDERYPPAVRETVTPAAFSGEAPEFEFRDRWFAAVVPPAT